MIQLMTYK